MKIIGHLAKLLLIAFLITPIHCQKFSFGTCPTQTTVADLTIDTELAVIWREYARTPSVYSHRWTCVTYTFSAVTDDLLYSVRVQGLNKITGTSLSTTGTVIIAGGTGAMTTASHFFTLTFPDKRYNDGASYYIISASAGVYQVWYSCENVPFGKLENVFILVSSTATSADVAAAMDALSNLRFPVHSLKRSTMTCLG